MNRFGIGTAVVLLAWAAGVADAQGGGVVGTVFGPGAVGLQGATVTVAAVDGGSQRQVVTGEGGEFRVPDLEPGSYSVRGELRGFHPAEASGVAVGSDGSTRVELTLGSATFRDSLNVTAGSRHDTLESSELRDSAARDLGEALSRMPGVAKARTGGIASDVVLRGFRGDDITVLVDGARVAGACPNHMDPPAFHVDFAEVDRVEVAPETGRLSAQGSLGGMVNVVTRKPLEGWHADVSLTAGSFDLTNPSATLSYGSQRFGVLGGFSSRQGDPFEDGSGTSFVARANYSDAADGAKAFDVASGWMRAWYAPSERHELKVSYARQEADGVLYPALKMDAVFDDTDRTVLGYRAVPAGGPVSEVRATAYATSVEHWMTDALRTSAGSSARGWSMGTDASTSVVGGTVEADVGRLTLGLEAYLRTWDAWTEMGMASVVRQYSVPDVDTEVVGVTGRWERALGRQTLLEIAGRVDHVATAADEGKANTDLYYAFHLVRSTVRSDTEPSLSVRLVHQLSSAVSLSASAASTVRAPDARERYFGLKRMGVDWVGNPELDPPRATGGVLGVSWSGGSGSLTASAWVDQVDDFITLYGQDRLAVVPGVMSPRAQTYANVDATILGLSVEGSAALGSRLFLAGSAAWLRGTKERDPGLGLESTALAGMAPLSGRLALRWQSPRYFVEVEGVGAAEQDRVDTDLDERATPGWAILNLKAGLSARRWRLQLVLENLLDRTYHEHLSYVRDPYSSGLVVNEPGRQAVVTLGWSL